MGNIYNHEDVWRPGISGTDPFDVSAITLKKKRA